MDNPFSWDYLSTKPTSNEVFGVFAISFLVIFGVGFLVSLVIYSGGGRRLLRDAVLRKMAVRWSAWVMTICGLGLFFFLIRALQINPFYFGMRIWLWLCLLALVAFAAYMLYDYRSHYPEAKKAYEARKVKNQYLRPGAPVTRSAGNPGTTVTAPRPVRRRRR